MCLDRKCWQFQVFAMNMTCAGQQDVYEQEVLTAPNVSAIKSSKCFRHPGGLPLMGCAQYLVKSSCLFCFVLTGNCLAVAAKVKARK